MHNKIIIFTIVIGFFLTLSIFILPKDVSPLVDCVFIEVNVEDEEDNPLVGYPVKLVAETYGDSWVLYTDGNGDAKFQLEDWPNECPPNDPCCPAWYNAGEYHYKVLDYCIRQDFGYEGGALRFYVEIEDTTLKCQ